MLNWKQYKDRPLVAVHRGYHGGNILPNTVESVRAALAAADIAEIDISYVGGECFVFHDGEESRMFGFLTNLERMTPEAVRRLRYANKYGCLIDHPVNTLDEILEAAAGGYVNIDRCWKSAEEVAAVVGIVKKHGMLDKAVFKSTANFAGNFKDQPVEYLVIAGSVDDIRRAEAIRPLTGAELLFTSADGAREMVAYCRQKGYLTWGNSIVLDDRTVLSAHLDDKGGLIDPDANWGELYRLGFDVIQTDFPADVMRYFAHRH